MCDATFRVAMWEKMIVKMTANKDDWFMCSFCENVVFDKPFFNDGISCLCQSCKEDEEIMDEIEELNEIYKDESELYMFHEEEYRGDKKEDDEEIDHYLYENFKEDVYNDLYSYDTDDTEVAEVAGDDFEPAKNREYT